MQFNHKLKRIVIEINICHKFKKMMLGNTYIATNEDVAARILNVTLFTTTNSEVVVEPTFSKCYNFYPFPKTSWDKFFQEIMIKENGYLSYCNLLIYSFPLHVCFFTLVTFCYTNGNNKYHVIPSYNNNTCLCHKCCIFF